MVRVSPLSSDGCGFDPRLGLRNRFSEAELQERSSVIIMIHNFCRGRRVDCLWGSLWIADCVRLLFES